MRIVHLGLGAFHRSHQAWYTHQASDAADWGIAAFTGRRPDAALALAEQDGLYTVVERADDGDSFDRHQQHRRSRGRGGRRSGSRSWWPRRPPP